MAHTHESSGWRTRWSCAALLMVAAAGCDDSKPQAVGRERATLALRQLSVAAASDLKFAFDELISGFERENPEIRVRATFGSSGNFYAQLSNHAPFDLFYSADIEYPRRLAADGLAATDSLFQYAVGRIVVWVPGDSLLDMEARGIEAIADPRVKKVAIANPQHAPYGRAAVATMVHYGVHEQLKERLVYGENVAQAAQFVESGAADAGIIALSLALAPAMRDRGRYWQVPLDAYPRLEQGGVIMSSTKDLDAALRLREFTMGPRGREILARFGFVLPGD